MESRTWIRPPDKMFGRWGICIDYPHVGSFGICFAKWGLWFVWYTCRLQWKYIRTGLILHHLQDDCLSVWTHAQRRRSTFNLWKLRTCSIEHIKSNQEPVMRLNDNILVSELMLPHGIHYLGNWSLWGKRRESSELLSFKIWEVIHHPLNNLAGHPPPP